MPKKELKQAVLPPNAISYEEEIIGTMLLEEPMFVKQAFNILTPEMFYVEKHKLIFNAMKRLFDRDLPINLLTVCNDLKNKNELEEVGGAYYVTTLSLKKTMHLKYYSYIIKEKWIRRRLIEITQTSQNSSYDDSIDTVDLLNELLREVETLSAPFIAEVSRLKTPKDVFDSVLDYNEIKALKTGIKLFDEKIFLMNGNVYLIGKGGSGKTSLLRCLIKNILVNEYNKTKISVLWNTMEDSVKSIMACMLASEILEPAKDIMKNRIPEHKKQTIKELEYLLDILDITYQDQPKSIEDIFYIWKNFMQKKKLEGTEKVILIIDNFNKLYDNPKLTDVQNDNYKSTFITNKCWAEAKRIYGDENCLILTVHHINKANNDKSNYKNLYIPSENDSRGSSKLFDDSTVFLTVHSFYNYNDIKRNFKSISETILKHSFVIGCHKNREGGWIGEEYLWGDLDLQVFDDMELIEEEVKEEKYLSITPNDNFYETISDDAPF